MFLVYSRVVAIAQLIITNNRPNHRKSKTLSQPLPLSVLLSLQSPFAGGSGVGVGGSGVGYGVGYGVGSGVGSGVASGRTVSKIVKT